MAEALATVLTEASLRQAFARGARRRVVDFSVTRHVERLQETYWDLMASRAAAAPRSVYGGVSSPDADRLQDASARARPHGQVGGRGRSLTLAVRRLKRSLRSSWRKNGREIRAFLTGDMPAFVTRTQPPDAIDRVPVFFFHDVEPNRFAVQLAYLISNGYRTIDGDEIETRLRGDPGGDDGRAVALTFDDGTWTFWTYVVPLLRRQGRSTRPRGCRDRGRGGRDSMMFVDLIMFIEDHFGVTAALEDLEIESFATVAKMARFVVARSAEAEPPAARQG